MSGLLGLGASSKQSQQETPATSLRIQTSVMGLPRPIGWGQARLSGNLIYYNNFHYTTTQSGGGGGGKGLLGGGGGKGNSGSTTYNYFTDVMIGICEGPINSIISAWNNKTEQSLASLNLTAFTGSYSQTAWGGVSSPYNLNYRGLAYVAGSSFSLGTSQELPNLSFEILFNYNSAISGAPDADPADVLTDVLTNSHYGVNFPSGNIGSLTSYSNYCKALGLVVSPTLTGQDAAASFIDDLMKLTNSEIVWSGSTLNVVPYGTTSVTGNGFTYTPRTANLYDFGDSDMLANANGPGGVGPVSMTRSGSFDEKNIVPLEYLDRTMDYNPNVVTATDDASVFDNGSQPMDKITAHMFCLQAAAQMSAQLQLGRQKARNIGTINLGPEFLLIDPMDLEEYVDAPLGANGQGICVKEIAENDDDSFTITFEEYGDGQGSAPVYGSQPNSGYIQNYQIAPGSVNAPAIFDVPVQLADAFGGLRTWVGISGAGAHWGGCNVFISSDNATFAFVQRVEVASRMGVLTATFPVGASADTVNTLSVDLTESKGYVIGGTLNDANQGNTLCFVDGEYVAYQQASLTSQYHYNLGKNGVTAGLVNRGMYGSTIASHAIGALFVRLDDNVINIPYQKTDVGKTIYIKLQSFNEFGGGLEDIASVTSYSHTIGGPPTLYAPTSLTVTAGIKSLQLNWTNPSDIGVEAVEIWRSASSSFAGATKIADAPPYSTSFTDLSTGSNTQYWYWIRIRDIAGNVGGYTPSTGGAGSTATTAQAGSNDLGAGSVTSGKIGAGAIDTDTLFAAGIEPIHVVSSLPTGTEGQVVVLTTDGKLYRYHSGAWSAAVPTVDLSGTISGAQIAAGAIDITKAGTGLTFVQIVSTLPGTATTGQFLFLTTDKKLYRYNGSVWVKTTDGADITASSITGGSIVGGTITGSLIAGGTITGSNIAGGTITGTNIVGGTITAGLMAANSITAGTIAAGAINASGIIVSNIIITGHITINSVNSNPSLSSVPGNIPTGSTTLLGTISFTQAFDYSPVTLTIQYTSTGTTGAEGIIIGYTVYKDGVQMPLLSGGAGIVVVYGNSTGSWGTFPSRAYMWAGNVRADVGGAGGAVSDKIIIVDAEVLAGSHNYQIYGQSSNQIGDTGYPYFTPIYGTSVPYCSSLKMNVTVPIR